MTNDELDQRCIRIQDHLLEVIVKFVPRARQGEPDIRTNIYMAIVKAIERLDPKLGKAVVPEVRYNGQYYFILSLNRSQ